MKRIEVTRKGIVATVLVWAMLSLLFWAAIGELLTGVAIGGFLTLIVIANDYMKA